VAKHWKGVRKARPREKKRRRARVKVKITPGFLRGIREFLLPKSQNDGKKTKEKGAETQTDLPVKNPKREKGES